MRLELSLASKPIVGLATSVTQVKGITSLDAWMIAPEK
jgi:hypothetical protein